MNQEQADPFMPLEAAALRAITGGDGVVVAYPRSGSRWLMLMLHAIGHAAAGDEERARWVFEEAVARNLGRKGRHPLERAMPFRIQGWNAHDFNELALVDRERGGLVIARSHHDRSIYDAGDLRIIYLFREFHEMIVSYWHFALASGHAKPNELEAFCLGRVPSWVSHVEAASRHGRARPRSMVLVRYQGDGVISSRQLQRCLELLGLDCPLPAVAFVRELFRAALERINGSGRFPVRRGGTIGAREFLPEALYRRLDEATRPAFEEACRLEAGQGAAVGPETETGTPR